MNDAGNRLLVITSTSILRTHLDSVLSSVFTSTRPSGIVLGRKLHQAIIRTSVYLCVQVPEGVLSRRLLVFSNQEMSFYCQETAWTELLGDMSHLQGEQNIPWQKLSRDCSPFDYTFRPRPSNESGTYAGYERQVQAILGNYCHQVAIYSRRRLTYDYDALNAFAGFMQHYSEETRPIPIMRTMSGLPIKIFTSDGRPGTASIFITLTWHHAPPDTMQLPAWKTPIDVPYSRPGRGRVGFKLLPGLVKASQTTGKLHHSGKTSSWYSRTARFYLRTPKKHQTDSTW